MKEISNISNIDKLFCVFSDNIYFVRIDNNYFYLHYEKQIVQLDSRIQKIFELDHENLILVKSNGKGILLNKRTNNFNLIDLENVSFVHDHYIIYYIGGLFDRTFGVYDLSSKKINFETKFVFGKYYYENLAIIDIQGNIYCREMECGNLCWEFSLLSFGSYYVNGEERQMDVQKYIGVNNGILYIKAGANLILGIEVSSGEEVFNFQYKFDTLVLDNLCLDHNFGVIFSIGPTSYFELNLKTNHFELHDLTMETQRHKVETSRLGSWYSNFIFFWEGNINNRFGIFNKISREIIWVGVLENVEGKYPAIKDVKYCQNKLFVLDYFDSLHIFHLSI